MSIPAAYIVPHPPIIIPEVGRGRETEVQTTIDSYHEIARQIGELRPQTIIIISPHSVMYADYIHVSPGESASGSLKTFGAPKAYSVRYDAELRERICGLCDKYELPAGTLGEKDPELDHGTLIPLYFINQYWKDYQLIRCSISGLLREEHYRFGMILREAVEAVGREAVIVASGDLSHKLAKDGPYGFVPEGPELDRRLTDTMRVANFEDFLSLDEALCEKGAECGLGAFITMAGAFDRRAVTSQFLSYEGTFGVGYAICAFKDAGEDKNRNFLDIESEKNKLRVEKLRGNEDAYVRLARETLEGYVITGRLPELEPHLPEELINERAGVFVSIKKRGQLRGCIGTTAPTARSIAEEIRQNAVSSGTSDPRFSPVTADELSELVYNVDVLTPASPCEVHELDVKRYGIIVTSGRKRGLLLPDLDGVDTVEEQIDIACRKAGIGKHEKYTLERFEVVRHR